MTRQADIVVIGAGLAGLTAARRLVEAGADVALVEARERVGGRTHTAQLHGATVDVGGQWVGPEQPRMYALCEELGIELFPTPVGGKQALDLGDRVVSYGGTIPWLGVSRLVLLQALIWRLEHLRRGIDPTAPWEHPHAEALDATTLEAFSRHIPSETVRKVLRPTIRTVFGAEPGELSLLHVAWYAASAGGFMPLVEVDGGFQQDRFLHGAQQVSDRLASKVGLGRLTLGAPVRRVAQDDEGVTVDTDEGPFRAQRVVCAAPLALLDRIRWEPGLPTLRDQLHQRCPMGATVKVFCAYDRPFWRDAGFSGEGVCAEGPVSVCFDNTAPGGPPMLLAFITGGPARDWAQRDEDARREEVLGWLARVFGEAARHPTWVHEQDWTVDPWAGGCPITQFPPGTLSRFGPALRTPVGRIHWAGTETARSCTGFMEGAVESGERAATEILRHGPA